LPKCLATSLPASLPTVPGLPIPPAPGLPAVPGVVPVPGPGASPGGQPKAAPAKSATGDPGLVAPAAISVITADSVTMDHFVYQGNAKLPTASGGAVTMMKFTASSLTLSGHVADAITEAGVTAVTSSPVMAFNGNVVIYSTKLSGSLLGVPLTFTPSTISGLELKAASLFTGLGQVTLTSVTTDQVTGTADSLTYGPGGGGFSVTLH
jgi:hypothetical protein